MNLFTSGSAKQSLHDRLVEAESIIGGGLFKKPDGVLEQRFWYHEGDWFYESHDVNGPVVARYQFINGQVIKLVEGRLVHFAEGEVTNLHKMIELYHDKVYEQLYAPKNDLSLAA
jgi:hypothetical protein